MMQYEVTVTKTVMVFIDAETEDEALERAKDAALECPDMGSEGWDARITDSWEVNV